MQRRTFLELAAGLCVVAQLPALGFAASKRRRTLILLELKGGNDGLNMIVPYADPAYYTLRPRLGIKRDTLLQLDERLALHPAMQPLLNLWQEKVLAIALGVGYPQPSLSHFRSIDIWETAVDSHDYLDTGWVSQLYQQAGLGKSRSGDIVSIGHEAGPLRGNGLNTLIIADTKRFLKQAGKLGNRHQQSTNPALQHILAVQDTVQQAAGVLSSKLVPLKELAAQLPEGQFGRQLALAAQLILSPTPPAIIKLSLGSFDTHTQQAGRQQRLLSQLAQGIAGLSKLLKATNHWQNTLMLTYSEFGRRAAENASGGTDHGTAAAHLITGGAVRGGFYGEQPLLSQLENGNLRHTLDFRQLYATVAQDWWQLMPLGDKRFPVLPFLRSG